jgi:hypothetical protein
VTDALMTNFHLPKSTLMMLVSALMGRRASARSTPTPSPSGYRFFSYGDASLAAFRRESDRNHPFATGSDPPASTRNREPTGMINVDANVLQGSWALLARHVPAADRQRSAGHAHGRARRDRGVFDLRAVDDRLGLFRGLSRRLALAPKFIRRVGMCASSRRWAR